MSFLINGIKSCCSWASNCLPEGPKISGCVQSCASKILSGYQSLESGFNKVKYGLLWLDDKTLKLSPSIRHIYGSIEESRKTEAGLGVVQFSRGASTAIGIGTSVFLATQGMSFANCQNALSEAMLLLNGACNFILELSSALKAKQYQSHPGHVDSESLPMQRILNENFLEKLQSLKDQDIVSSLFEKQFYSSAVLSLAYVCLIGFSSFKMIHPGYLLAGTALSALMKFSRYAYFNRYLNKQIEISKSMHDLMAESPIQNLYADQVRTYTEIILHGIERDALSPYHLSDSSRESSSSNLYKIAELYAAHEEMRNQIASSSCFDIEIEMDPYESVV